MHAIRSALFFGVGGLAVAAGACKDDAVTPSPVVPYAAIQYVNAVSDTGEMDFRVIDIVSNSGLFDVDFREFDEFAKPIEAGQRRIRVFMSSQTDQSVASDVVWDTTAAFTEGGYYKFLLTGFARPGQTPALQARIVADPAPPTVGPGQFAIRVLNLAPSLAGSIRTLADTGAPPDAFLLSGTAVPGGTPTAGGVAYLGSSAYAVVDTGRYRIAITSTGTTDPTVVQATLPLGQASPRIAGSRIAGSVLTAVIVPRSVPGSNALQTRPSSLRTDTSAAEASRRITRSNDTVTVQTGSIARLVNRPDTIVFDTSFVVDPSTGDTTMVVVPDTLERADTTLGTTGTGVSTGTARFDVVLVSGAAEPEYNGWQTILAGSGTLGASGVADTLLCNPVDADTTGGSDTPGRCNAANANATTRFRFRYRIVGTPASPGTGTVVYRMYAPVYAAADYVTPQIIFLVDRRP
jgi:hypothetical protein